MSIKEKLNLCVSKKDLALLDISNNNFLADITNFIMPAISKGYNIRNIVMIDLEHIDEANSE